ncbi:MAG: hypothetical protein JXR84_08165, partial [Anaerolineae bacterium]|nr:hypothetical protein [Anaerolineae bacterium]
MRLCDERLLVNFRRNLTKIKRKSPLDNPSAFATLNAGATLADHEWRRENPTMTYLTVKEMPHDERPRERMERVG